MKNEKYYTVKEWNKFKKTKVKEIDGIKHYYDMQELMCKKYNIILTDYKTKREKCIIFLRKINMKNINKGIDTFNKAVQAFGGSMDKLSKELDGSEKSQSDNHKKNLEEIWGKSSKGDVKIWSDHSITESKSRKRQDKMNIEKIWGKKK